MGVIISISNKVGIRENGIGRKAKDPGSNPSPEHPRAQLLSRIL